MKSNLYTHDARETTRRTRTVDTMRRFCVTFLLLLFLAATRASAFSVVEQFNSYYVYTNTAERIQLSQVSISMATSVANSVTLSVITAAGITNDIYSVTSSIFALTLWPPNGVSTSVYLYAGDKLRATSTATNNAWLTFIYSSLSAEQYHGTSNIIAHSISEQSMGTNSVPGYAIQSNAVTSSKLATNSVNGGHIIDGSITADDLADGAIEASQMGTNVIYGTSNIVVRSITGDQIATNTLGADEIEASGVTAGTYTNVTLTVDEDGRITVAANGSVPTNVLQNLSSVLTAGNNGGGLIMTNMGSIQSTNNVRGNTVQAVVYFVGPGSGITDIRGSNINAGTVGASQIANTALSLLTDDGGSTGYTQEGPYTTTSGCYGPWDSVAIFTGFVGSDTATKKGIDVQYSDDCTWTNNVVVAQRVQFKPDAAEDRTYAYYMLVPKGKVARVYVTDGAPGYYIRYGVLEL